MRKKTEGQVSDIFWKVINTCHVTHSSTHHFCNELFIWKQAWAPRGKQLPHILLKAKSSTVVMWRKQLIIASSLLLLLDHQDAILFQKESQRSFLNLICGLFVFLELWGWCGNNWHVIENAWNSVLIQVHDNSSTIRLLCVCVQPITFVCSSGK